MLGFAFLAGVLGVVLAVAFWFQWQSASGAVLALRGCGDGDEVCAAAGTKSQPMANTAGAASLSSLIVFCVLIACLI